MRKGGGRIPAGGNVQTDIRARETSTIRFRRSRGSAARTGPDIADPVSNDAPSTPRMTTVRGSMPSERETLMAAATLNV